MPNKILILFSTSYKYKQIESSRIEQSAFLSNKVSQKLREFSKYVIGLTKQIHCFKEVRYCLQKNMERRFNIYLIICTYL